MFFFIQRLQNPVYIFASITHLDSNKPHFKCSTVSHVAGSYYIEQHQPGASIVSLQIYTINKFDHYKFYLHLNCLLRY